MLSQGYVWILLIVVITVAVFRDHCAFCSAAATTPASATTEVRAMAAAMAAMSMVLVMTAVIAEASSQDA